MGALEWLRSPRLNGLLDSGFHRSDDFLRDHQNLKLKNNVTFVDWGKLASLIRIVKADVFYEFEIFHIVS